MAQPKILWAQNRTHLFLTIEAADCKLPRVEVQNDTEKGTSAIHVTWVDSEGTPFSIRFPLLKYVNLDEGSQVISATPRALKIKLQRLADDADEWQRLPLNKSLYSNAQVDWDRWTPEEDDDDDAFSESEMDRLGGMSA